jgi:hypothetical protein
MLRSIRVVKAMLLSFHGVGDCAAAIVYFATGAVLLEISYFISFLKIHEFSLHLLAEKGQAEL